ncbi:integrase arm-type DNA-binding domain-containing protein [Citrobacter koseri]|uniref:tyrosine-type recombinase/integrase n=1 Tax=Citrobacter koseri TaxID=545 RepID=UPI0029433C09|nr:integrase arm-type DNA-binding domain-containing protein [Citrobacter koseri]MEB2704045.1 integrase arm-type DNA-binding domain-containing protein [Citrobacter koseri]MEB2709574.1 integrase arm-type DNA-binding domain-containing protein [Citrobacter koseri]WOJ30413.1 integrase arm-type DNA-binding domain-containing protein [Citrobacter koseri]WOJ34587.1 integrase arm-type DNA-binding domain-containing protein [Citrobacter koseri]
MLTDSKIRAAKYLTKSYKLTDSQGLYLTVSASGAKLWYLRYRLNGKESRLALGPYPQTTLAEAREKRDAARKLLASGISPSQLRKVHNTAVDESRTFQYVAQAWHTSSLKLWSDAHAAKILTCLKRYVFPVIGTMDIVQVETRHLSQLVKAIDDKGVHDVAGRVRQHLTKIMRHAVQQGTIKYNPAYDLDGVVSPVVTRHHPALPLNRLPELLGKINNYRGRLLTRLALELNLHVFLRSSELRLARWDEFNLKAHIWTVPAKRETVKGVRFSERGAKMKDEHLVPLSRQAVALLKQIQAISGESVFVFPGAHTLNKPMSENTINKALCVIGYDTKTEVCGHGFRTMACSALNESGRWSKDAIERQMSHKERNGVRAAYVHKAEHLEARIEMMQWWSDYLEVSREGYVAPYIYARQHKV